MGQRRDWAVAALFVATALVAVPLLDVARGVAMLAMLPFLIWAALSDLKTHEVPDICPLGLVVIGLALLPFQGAPFAYFVTALIAGAVLWGGSEVFYRIRGYEALGLGDVKLIAAGALVVGPVGLWILMIVAPLGGIIYALSGGRRVLPFAPFISYGLILSLVGATILSGGGIV